MHGLPPTEMVANHLWIVDKFAHAHRALGPLDDLLAAGSLGLVVAADRFEPTKGAQFGTYAWNWVKGHVLAEVRKSHVVAVPEHTARAANKRGEPVRGVVVFTEPDETASSEELEQERAADRSMRLRALHVAIEALESDDHRHVINRTLAGRSVEQIAKGMGISRDKCRTLLSEAQTILARALDRA